MWRDLWGVLLVTGMLVLLWLCRACAADELVLSWLYDPDVSPPPESFLITYRSSVNPAGAQQFRVPNGGHASCAAIQTPEAQRPDAICGRTPDCLAPGIYVFWVQAERGGETSAANASASCEALPNCQYTCDRVALPPALQALVDASETPEGQQAPSGEDVQRAIDTLVPAPTTPPVASISTPAPTPAQVVDQVQAALDQMPRAPV